MSKKAKTDVYILNPKIEMVEPANNSGKSDAEMSMAIENLSAMLNIQDMDEAI